MSRPWRDAVVLAVLLPLMVAGSAHAADPVPPYVEVVGPQEQDIPALRPAAGPVQVHVPIRYPKPELAGKLDLRVTDVVFGGESRTDLRDKFTLTEQAGLKRLLAKVMLGQIPQTGSYALRAEVLVRGTPAAAPQELALTFTRPAAELQIPASPVRFENVRGLPWLGTGFSSRNLNLREASGRAGILPQSLRIDSELRGPGDFILPTRLTLKPPAVLDAGDEQPARLAADGTLPLGTSRGTLTFVSRQLAKPAAFTVEIISRVSRGWLFGILVLGIFAGAYLRTGLDRRRLRLEAEAAAQRRIGALQEIIGRTADEPLRKDLEAFLAEMRQALQIHRKHPDELKKAVEAAWSQAEERLKQAEAKRDELRQKITRLKVWTASPEAHPAAVRQILEDAARRLAGWEKDLGLGAITSVETALDGEEARLKDQIAQAVQGWIAETRVDLGELDRWEGTQLETARADLLARLGSLQTAQETLDVPELLRQESFLASRIRVEILQAGSRAVEIEADDLLKLLQGVTDLKDVLDRLNELRAWREQGTDLSRLSSFRAVFDALVGALRNAIQSATPASAAEEVKGLLAAGKLDEALARALAARQAEAQSQGRRGEIRESGEETQLFTRTRLIPVGLLPETAARPAWAIRIAASPNPSVGQEVRLEIVPEGTLPRDTFFRWSVAGEAAVSQGPGDLVWSFRPDRPGSLPVQVEAIVQATGERQEARITLEVRPAEGFAALAGIEDRLARTEWIQTVAYGILITAAGYLIFESAWIGTFQDFFAAFLWGFTVDIGVAKLREIATPLLARPVPLPAARAVTAPQQ